MSIIHSFAHFCCDQEVLSNQIEKTKPIIQVFTLKI